MREDKTFTNKKKKTHLKFKPRRYPQFGHEFLHPDECCEHNIVNE